MNSLAAQIQSRLSGTCTIREVLNIIESYGVPLEAEQIKKDYMAGNKDCYLQSLGKLPMYNGAKDYYNKRYKTNYE